MSSCESELYALQSGAAELMFVRTWLQEQGVEATGATIWSDSSSAIALCYKKGPGTKLKHVAVRALVTQDWVAQRCFSVAKVGTDDNAADFLTKAVCLRMFHVGCLLTQTGAS